MTKNNAKIAAWIETHKIDEVECLVPDMSGILRGKIIPARKFLQDLNYGIKLPISIFSQMVTGEYADFDIDHVMDYNDNDMILVPDEETIRIVPWFQQNRTAQVICDVIHQNKTEVDFAPRNILKKIINEYTNDGLTPIVAPEVEFYLVKKNIDPDYPLEAPDGVSGRSEFGAQAYGIDQLYEYDPIIDRIYEYCEAMNIGVDTITHESGPVQLEFNFNHGNPLALADQVSFFKRAVRRAALENGVFATFMAKPHENQPGSAMHIHQSIINSDTKANIFATKSGRDSKALLNYIGGLKKYTPQLFPLFAPNVNSYRRIAPYMSAPINLHWGIDNRTVGLRVPLSGANARRVENRVVGADTNPYLAFAGTLACGLLGMRQKISPGKEVEGNAYKLANNLPKSLHESIHKMSHSREIKKLLGPNFVELYCAVKLFEIEMYNRVISSWERKFLLTNV